MEEKVIRFCRANEKPYGCFSNLYPAALTYEGVCYPTAEHAYQAGKARTLKVREWLMAAPSPALLAMAAHGLYSWDIAPGWSRTRQARMLEVVRAKFSQHQDLAWILLETGDATIAESSEVDSEVNRRWGQVRKGDRWIGNNWLGVILMEVRCELRDNILVGESPLFTD